MRSASVTVYIIFRDVKKKKCEIRDHSENFVFLEMLKRKSVKPEKTLNIYNPVYIKLDIPSIFKANIIADG